MLKYNRAFEKILSDTEIMWKTVYENVQNIANKIREKKKSKKSTNGHFSFQVKAFYVDIICRC